MMFHRRGVIFLGFSLISSVFEAATPADPYVALEWRPQQQTIPPAAIAEVGLWIVPLDPVSVEFLATQLILTWDETKLELLGHVDPCDDPDCRFTCPESNTYNWMSSAFPADCAEGDGLNAPCDGGLPENDGDAFFTAFPWPLCYEQQVVPIIPPSGLWLTSFRFRAVADSGTGTVDIEEFLGSTSSLVVIQAVWGYDGLREIRPAAEIDIGCMAPATQAAGSRYVQLTVPQGVGPIALRILGDPADPDINCVTQYVQAPAKTCTGGSEHRRPCAADAECPGGSCHAFAGLGPDPLWLAPEEWGTVLLHGVAIRPAKRYQIQTLCAPDESPTLSDPVGVKTWAWGDVDHDGECSSSSTDPGAICVHDSDCPGGYCDAVDFIDISKVVQGFKTRFSDTVTLPSTDLAGAGCIPDRNVDFIDIGTDVQAFKRMPFSCSVDACP